MIAVARISADVVMTLELAIAALAVEVVVTPDVVVAVSNLIR